jgi:NagD protein
VTERSGIIFDLDGTVYRGDQLIPGARETIEKLRRWGYPLVFVTNALETPAEHAAKLTRFKIPTSPDEVITAPLLVTRYLGRHMPNATVFAISDPPLLTQLEANFRLSEDPEEIDVVIVSCDLDFNFRKLNIGFQALKRGARFLAINADATCPVPGGEIPDAGAIIGALEGCSKRKLELVIGKPSPMVVEAVLERLDKPAGDCLMVGDNLESDIVMGQRAGMSTVLVLTGVTQPADLAHAPIEPDHVLDSIAQLPQLLEKN